MSAASGTVLDVRVTPRAGRTEAVGWQGGALVIRLAAPPVDGAANEALLSFLARLLDVPARTVTMAGGARSRRKRVRVATLSASELAERLSGLPVR